MVRVDEDAEIPDTGAVFTFGKSRFADNIPSKFWFRNDVVTRLACGDEHTLVATANGRLYGFGNNDWGQLGIGTTRNISKPTCIKALKHEKIRFISAGRSHSLIYTESGLLYAFGANGEGQLGLGDTVDRHEPRPLEKFDSKIDAIKSVAAGSYHSAVLTGEGKLFTFGSNNHGQLGLGEAIDKIFVPTQVQIDAPVSYVSCGYYHTAFIANGKLYTFGEKEGGKLGLLEKQLNRGTSLPQCIFSITERVASVSCGGNHTALLTECGKLYTFGSGLNGQLGLGAMVMETGAPSLVGALDSQTILSVSCGESHTAILIEHGRLLTCGDGRHGKLALGNDNFSNQFNPVPVKDFRQYFVHQVSCGGCHMVLLATKRALDDPILNTTDDLGDTFHSISSSSTGIDTNDGSLLTARGRRREKELQQNKTLLPIGRSLPPLTNPDFKMGTQISTNDDLDRLQQELTEINDNEEGDASRRIPNQSSEINNQTHELLLVDGAQESVTRTLKPQVRQSSLDNKNESQTLEVIKNNKTSVGDASGSSSSSSSSSSSDTESDAEEPINSKGEEQDSKNEGTKVEQTTKNNEEQPKKESFFKKIFSFKKKKSSSKLVKKESFKNDAPQTTSNDDPLIITSTSPPEQNEIVDNQEQNVHRKSDSGEIKGGGDAPISVETSASDKKKTIKQDAPNVASKTCIIL